MLVSCLVSVSAFTGLSAEGTAKFAQVGVIEGFFGTPWSHQDRLDILHFMGSHGLPAYYYAPKDDPYHREEWRKPCTGKQLERFSELLKTAQENKVDLYFAISPGLSVVYSNAADFKALTDKLDAMYELGVRHFTLFLDDVPEHLADARDRQVFSRVAAAHSDLINRAYAHLKAKCFAWQLNARQPGCIHLNEDRHAYPVGFVFVL
jgi:hypothetical protein